ncbi:DUF3152 domain-containing protein [Streptomyces sp. ID05-04B]|uniref:DUF3152 domain-containing protein n=1 Tax=Streptomyces sp. P3 TaxID=2135430 RepID=UPI000D1AE088|nr:MULTISPECIES: DUF3152 domain-containing protein [unclassified Streptomyces]AVV40615.1 hypothetical protein C6376_03420 [Streptomyces sp. P3]MDX5569870.1 DUF3152 domain-containing protein [Streptomyces sp. ID05-04B]
MGRHSRRGPAPKRAGDGAPRGASQGAPQGSPAGPAQGEVRGGRTQAPAPPLSPDGTPAHGVPRFADGTPARGFPQARGGHPEQRETGGGWGDLRARQPGTGQPVIPRQRPVPPNGPGQSPRPSGRGARQGPRQDYLDAFGADEEDDVFTRARPTYAPPRRREHVPPAPDAVSRESAPVAADRGDGVPPAGDSVPAARGGKGRAFTGIAAAAVTTVLAVVVAGQVTEGRGDEAVRSQSATERAERGSADDATRGDDRPSPSVPPGVVTLTYAQKMSARYPLAAALKGSGKFDAIAGVAKAPGKGRKYTYRVDVEQGLGLDGELFAQAVQKTLNDDRSWAHGGARTFERIHSGKPDFVITLASPGTTAEWCAKSGLDTTEDNVSCDSAATERVMINAYRWAQGSPTFGDQMYAYRQMLINHEVGHRLGFGHVTCDKDGELAPVMQQQTKFLDHDGIHCLPNAWAFPGS